MKSAEDFFLLVLHAHAIVAAENVQSLNPVESARELSRLIVVSSITLPDISDQDGSNLAQSPSS